MNMHEGGLNIQDCWFCKRKPEEDAARINIDLQYTISVEMVAADQDRITYKRTHVAVPRCKECMTVHEKPSPIGILSAATSVVGLTALGVLGQSRLPVSLDIVGFSSDGQTTDITLIVAGLVLGIMSGLFLYKRFKERELPEEVKSIDAVGNYPPYAVLINQGWREIERTIGLKI